MNLENPNKAVQEEIDKLEDEKAEAIATLDGDREGQLEQQILALKAKLETTVEQTTATPKYQEDQITNQGGTLDELNTRTEGVDNKIEEIKESVEVGLGGEIEKVAENNIEEKPKSLAEVPAYLEKIKENGKAIDAQVKSFVQSLENVPLDQKEAFLFDRHTNKASIESYANSNNKSYEDAVSELFKEDLGGDNYDIRGISFNKMQEKFPEIKPLMAERSKLAQDFSVYSKLNQVQEAIAQSSEEGNKIIEKYKHVFTEHKNGDGALENNFLVARELVKMGILNAEDYNAEINARIADVASNYSTQEQKDKAKEELEGSFGL